MCARVYVAMWLAWALRRRDGMGVILGLQALSVGDGEEIRSDLRGKLVTMLCKELLAKHRTRLRTYLRTCLLHLFTDHLLETVVQI